MALAGLWRAGVTVWMLATWGATGWTLTQHPFAEPVAARGAEAAQQALARAIARQISDGWLVAELTAAVAAEDAQDADILLEIADARDVPLPPDLRQAAAELTGAGASFAEQALDCAACAYDITTCRTLAQIGTCALSVELTPLGDLNALRRTGEALWKGQDVDELEAGLAVLGLAATGTILVSGGSSATVKAGATLTRVARQMDALSPRLVAELAGAVRGLIQWDRVPDVLRGAPAVTALDAVRSARLAAAATDVGRIARATSPAQTLAILRFAETPDDLARLARLSETAGGETRAALRVLGPARAYRALDRLSGPFLAALGLLGLVAAQIGSLVGGLLLRSAAPRRMPLDPALASSGGHRP